MRNDIAEFLRGKLKLEVKGPATLINNGLHSLPFLGVRIFPNSVRFKRENFNRSFSKLKTREWQFRNGLIGYEQYTGSMQSLIAHLTYFGNNLLENRLYKGTVS